MLRIEGGIVFGGINFILISYEFKLRRENGNYFWYDGWIWIDWIYLLDVFKLNDLVEFSYLFLS